MHTLTHKLAAAAAGCAIVVALASCSSGGAHKGVNVFSNSNGTNGTAVGSNNHQPTPSGYPSDWQARAIEAARQQLANCAQATDLSPSNCPQTTHFISGLGSTPEAAQWTLTQPLTSAVAVYTPANFATTTPTVDVYGRYAMTVTYAAQGQAIRPTGDFSGGIAHATMAWDGSSFQNVAFDRSVLASMLPNGVSVAPFARPNPPTNDQVLGAVTNAMHDCITLRIKPTDPDIPNCPQNGYTDGSAASGTWSNANGTDPMDGAILNFDPNTGAFTVSGDFDMNLHYVVSGNPGYYNNGPHDEKSSGNYKATVVWNNNALQVVTIVEA
jgi:hypothetical protein